MRGFTEALRSQAHEAANRLHTVVTLVELGRPTRRVRVRHRRTALAQQLTDQVVGAVAEPALAALLLGKSAQAGERGVELVIERTAGSTTTGCAAAGPVTIVGNLIDNAIEAVAGTDRRVGCTSSSARVDGESRPGRRQRARPGPRPGRGRVPRGWSTKSAGRGRGVLALVGQVVRRHGGSL